MAYTTPPVFTRPDGNPNALLNLAGTLAGVGQSKGTFDAKTAGLYSNSGELHWENRPDDVIWDGNAQVRWANDAVRRYELAQLASATCTAAANVLTGVAQVMNQAQSLVDQAQQLANQRAAAGAADPMPTTFENEQTAVGTATSLANANFAEAAAQIRALTTLVPGYVAPAVASGGGAVAMSTTGSGTTTLGGSAPGSTGSTPGAGAAGGAGAGAGQAGGTNEPVTDSNHDAAAGTGGVVGGSTNGGSAGGGAVGGGAVGAGSGGAPGTGGGIGGSGTTAATSSNDDDHRPTVVEEH